MRAPRGSSSEWQQGTACRRYCRTTLAHGGCTACTSLGTTAFLQLSMPQTAPYMDVQITAPYGGMKACRWLPAMVSVLMRMPATGKWVGG